ncbi:hypothetical protein G9A89_014026 [Geosiphon pyriformis]|nr:hypothetical protein G9A89_014026 [Geosiphon pyriformis]
MPLKRKPAAASPSSTGGKLEPKKLKVDVGYGSAPAGFLSSVAADTRPSAPPIAPAPVAGNCLMWFRTDLRMQDNYALSQASRQAVLHQRFLYAIFIISPQDWKLHDVAPIRVDFILRNLAILKNKLDELNIPLVVENVDKRKNIPETIMSYCDRYKVTHIFANKEYEVDETKRDITVDSLAKSHNVIFKLFDDQCVIPPGVLRTKNNNVYTVFTPFKKTWLNTLENEPHYLEISPNPKSNDPSIRDSPEANFDLNLQTFVNDFQLTPTSSEKSARNFPAGEEEAQRRLANFIQTRIKDYHDARNYPSIEGSSALSPYLASGIISARQCVVAARQANSTKKLQAGKQGITTWIEEIAWRDFYRNVLFSFPYVCKNQPYKKETAKLAWNTDPEPFKRWCEGKTGYPIVDAGMNQLIQLGWMHNRLRMIVAMFLVKDLQINWQLGEKYFMENLIDGDFASNNGGWQWCASTGTDAQPYFRIFNPTLQSQNFDPRGEFIKKWVPELKGLSPKQIHEPYASLSPQEFATLKYPPPIVDHKEARKKTLDMFNAVMPKKRA